MRLDKFLVACAVGSRTEVKNFLKAGRVTVNGKKEKSAKLQINEDTDEICFDGKKLEYEEFVYYMMNKPQGVISATEDPKHKTVLNLLDDYACAKEVFPVGAWTSIRMDSCSWPMMASWLMLFFHQNIMWIKPI